MSDVQTSIILSLRDFVKSIPYESAVRTDGSVCHGFILLKGKAHEAIKVPEASDNAALMKALETINDRSTAFFTVGCEKAVNREGSKFWAKGYLEFSFNHSDLVLDAQNYFKLFFDFNHAIWEYGFNLPVQFHWKIDRAWFSNGDLRGFTTSVWITTAELASEDECKNVWSKSISFLSDFLSSIKAYESPIIY